MSLGPVDMVVVKFPGNHFRGEIVPALKDLVEHGTIRIIDLLFIRKDQAGEVTVTEVTDLDDETYAVFHPLVSDIQGLFSDNDVQQFAAGLENNSSAGLLLFENTWAARLSDALAGADGELVLSERIPRAVIEEVLTASAAAEA
ncbi:MAG: DUF6325 family protein [Dehalococcoidia bacterium]